MTCAAVSEVAPSIPSSTFEPVERKAPEVPTVCPQDRAISRVALHALREAEAVLQGEKRKEAVQAAALPEKVRKVDVVAEGQREQLFVQYRKAIMRQKLDKWKEGYDPAPAFLLSLIPGMNRIVHIESYRVLDTFMAKLDKAQSRQKLASLLRKNAQILRESMFCMNAASERKMKEACDIIERELKMIGHVEEKAPATGEKKVRAVAKGDSLFAYKTRLMEKLDEWKKDFDPQPMHILACVPGVMENVTKKAKRLFDNLYKGIVKSESKEKLVQLLSSSKELVTNYSLFVSSATQAKLTAACAILSAELAELTTT